MTIQRHFIAMVDIPHNSGLTTWQAEFMKSTKANIDLLTGANVVSHMAVVRGDVTVNEVSPEGITGDFTAADHVRVAQQLVNVSSALNRLISEMN